MIAHAIKKLSNNNRASEFFELCNSFFFDTMNSRAPELPASQPMRSAYDMNLKLQRKLVNRQKNKIKTLRVIRKKSLPFQNGILVSIKSVERLYKDLYAKGIWYIITCRLMQDVLESFF